MDRLVSGGQELGMGTGIGKSGAICNAVCGIPVVVKLCCILAVVWTHEPV